MEQRLKVVAHRVGILAAAYWVFIENWGVLAQMCNRLMRGSADLPNTLVVVAGLIMVGLLAYGGVRAVAWAITPLASKIMRFAPLRTGTYSDNSISK